MRKKLGPFTNWLNQRLSGTSTMENIHDPKWNEYYGKYTRSGVKKAYKEGVGNVAEINLMLTAMLRYAGLNANPVLVSTRANGIPLFPTREGYNYVISGVDSPNGMVLLDATDAYSSPNILPFRTLSSTGDLAGKTRTNYFDHDATAFRRSFLKSTEEDYLEELEKKNGQIEIDNFEVKNIKDLSKPPSASYEFNLEGDSELIADKLYFAPMSFMRTETNPFTTEKREFPIDFGYPSSTKSNFSISIPEGYKIESMPESVSLALPEGMGVFKFLIQESPIGLQLNVTTDIKTPIVPATYYDGLKEYYKKMIEKMNEKVVLSKV